MEPFDIVRAYEAGEEVRQCEEKLAGLYCRLMRTIAEADAVLGKCRRDEQGLHEALAAFRGGLLECLRVEGVVPFGQEGELVDYARHVVTAWRARAGAAGRVIAVERQGLEWNGRVIMKAAVVASPAEDAISEKLP